MSRKTLYTAVFAYFFLSALSYASLVVCLDGGGTKTLVSLLKEGSACPLRVCSQASANSTSTSLRLGPANTQDEVRERALVADVLELAFWDEACQGWVPLRDVVDELSVVAGLAGVGGSAKQASWARYFEDQGLARCNIHIDSDVGLSLATLDAPAIVLIAGTGSVCFGKTDDSGQALIRAGGLGWFLGDEGSGFDVGRQAIRVAFREHRPDAQIQSPFVEHIFRHLRDTFGISTIGALHARILGGEFLPTQIAAFAPIVFDLAKRGDEHACAILDEAAESLARLLAEVLSQMHITEVPVYLIGGLFKDEAFLERVKAKTMLHRVPAAPAISWDSAYLNANPAEKWALLYIEDH